MARVSCPTTNCAMGCSHSSPGQGLWGSGVWCCYVREEGESACLCLVSALVIRPVLLYSVMWRFVRSATRSGKYHLYVYRMEFSVKCVVFRTVSTPLL